MLKKLRKIIRKFLKRLKRIHYKFNILSLAVIFSCSLIFPQHTLAKGSLGNKRDIKLQGIIIENTLLSVLNQNVNNFSVKSSRLPEIKDKKLELSRYSYVTAYNVGVVAQTDNTPCVGASGDDLCELVGQGVNVCAANFVRLGTYLEIEGIGKCIVLDRMNKRYNNVYPPRIDFAMGPDEIPEAKQFGLRYKQFDIY